MYVFSPTENIVIQVKKKKKQKQESCDLYDTPHAQTA